MEQHLVDLRRQLQNFTDTIEPGSSGSTVQDSLISTCVEIDSEIGSVESNAALALQQIEDTRAAALAAINVRCDELAALVKSSQLSKTVALEAERVAVDSALECLQHACTEAASAARTMSDVVLQTEGVEVATRARAALAAAARIPRFPMTQSALSFDADPSLLTSLSRLGAIVVEAPSVFHLELGLRKQPWPREPDGSLRTHLVLPGGIFEMVLRAETAAASSKALLRFQQAALNYDPLQARALLDRCVSVDAVLLSDDPAPRACPVSVSTRFVTGSVSEESSRHLALMLTLQVDPSAQVGSRLAIRSLSVCGCSALPAPPRGVESTDTLIVATVSSRLATGLRTPLVLDGMARDGTPCVSADGRVFCPTSASIYMWGCQGEPLSNRNAGTLRLSHRTCASAYDDETRTLFLGDWDGARSVVVAVAPDDDWSVRWSTEPGRVIQCGGLTVLARQGIVVASACEGRALHALRIDTGASIGPPVPANNPTYLATDSMTGTIFADTSDGAGNFSVARWQWSEPEQALVPLGVIEAAGVATNWRPIAVMPPAPGKRLSHLIVGTYNSSVLRILALPSLELVADTSAPNDMVVWGLAADPAGTALVILDHTSRAAQVVAWPWAGLPPLY